MDINSILFILALLILVGLFVAQPLAARQSVVVSPMEQEISTLLAERDRILEALTELDFDHSMDKVPEENYPAQRATLVEQGAQVLRQLDTHQQETGKLQSEMGEVRGQSDELEILIANRRKSRIEQPASFCHNCGKPVQPEDQFCAHCGLAFT